nr:negative elongation factor E isoform X1 [Drosophila takahashii]
MSQHSHTAIEYWTEFFRMYRSMPELWLVRSKLYRDRRLKDQSYGRLLGLMRVSDSHANIHTLKRKINNFRTSYRRELRKVLESDNNYVPSLWYFKELDFLYELETGELQLANAGATRQVAQEQESKFLQDHETIAQFQPVTESDETLGFMQPDDLTEESENDEVQQMGSEDDDMFSEPFHTEEDVLRLEAVGDGEAEPEPELEPEHDQDPETEAEHKVDDYQGNIKNNPYANNPSSSIATDKTNRRIRIRRRRSSNDTDYGETGRKRRVEEIPDRDRDRDRERERDRDRGRDRERESESENECELIGRRMATHFRHMRPDQRLYAERIISEVLVYGRMNRLSFEARFLPGPK